MTKQTIAVVITIEKIQPRRVMLEETNIKNNSEIFKQTMIVDGGDAVIEVRSDNVWREVKETDIPFTNEDSNVKMGVSQGDGEGTITLTKQDMRNLIEHIKLRGQLNPKIAEFIKDK